MTIDHNATLREALSFIEGFEGDELQQGIDGPDGLLARLRAVIDTPERPAVVINITGGVFQGASSTVPVDVYCLDFDVMDTDASDVMETDEGAAIFSEQSAKVDPSWVAMIIDTPTNGDFDSDGNCPSCGQPIGGDHRADCSEKAA